MADTVVDSHCGDIFPHPIGLAHLLYLVRVDEIVVGMPPMARERKLREEEIPCCRGEDALVVIIAPEIHSGLERDRAMGILACDTKPWRYGLLMRVDHDRAPAMHVWQEMNAGSAQAAETRVCEGIGRCENSLPPESRTKPPLHSCDDNGLISSGTVGADYKRIGT